MVGRENQHIQHNVWWDADSWKQVGANTSRPLSRLLSVLCLTSKARSFMRIRVGFASGGAFWGLFWLLGACLAFVLGGWLKVGRSSGMQTVKVHEWCLACYGWLALCLRNNFHPTCLFICLFRHLLPKRIVGFLCCIPKSRYCPD